MDKLINYTKLREGEAGIASCQVLSVTFLWVVPILGQVKAVQHLTLDEIGLCFFSFHFPWVEANAQNRTKQLMCIVNIYLLPHNYNFFCLSIPLIPCSSSCYAEQTVAKLKPTLCACLISYIVPNIMVSEVLQWTQEFSL